MWRKLSTDSGVTDFCIVVNGWILFSLLHIKVEDNTETVLVLFNHTVFERDTYK